MAEPSQLPVWATDVGATKLDPGTAKQQQGWVKELTPFEWWNWWMNLVYQWIVHFRTELNAVSAQQNNYDAIVGVGGTHVDIPTALAAVGSQSKILVIDDQVLQNRVDVNGLNDLVIEFKPGVQVTTVDNIPIAFQIENATRVQIIGGRWIGFNNVGDFVFNVLATAKNILITQGYFSDNDSDFQDAGTNTEINNISEVL